MAMKRKIGVLALALVLVIQLLGMPSAAAEQVYFTSVNESILELTEATMPFWSGGFLYVPSTVFSDSEELDFSYSRNLTKQTMVFWMPSQGNNALVFNLKNGTVTDGNGDAKSPGAIVRGSVVFVPVGLMASFFGLTYTNIPVSHGYLVRIRNSRSALPDAVFADAATSQMEARYEQYLQSKTDSQGGGTNNTEDPEEEEGEETEGKRLYLCFLADDTQEVEALLDALDQYRCQATFCCTEQFLEEGGALLRRMVGKGHSIALAVQDTEEAARGNELLSRATGGKTRLVYSLKGTRWTSQNLEGAGYCVLSPNMDWTGTGLRNYTTASSLFSKTASRSGKSIIWLGDQANAAGLSAFLGMARGRDDRLLPLTETTG
jgi:hypothetical protein